MGNPFKWAFLDEPLWRWFVFTIAMMLFLVAWSTVLGEMR